MTSNKASARKSMEKWERRSRKLNARRRRMGMSGRSLLTVIRPAIKRRAEAARRAGEERGKETEGSR